MSANDDDDGRGRAPLPSPIARVESEIHARVPSGWRSATTQPVSSTPVASVRPIGESASAIGVPSSAISGQSAPESTASSSMRRIARAAGLHASTLRSRANSTMPSPSADDHGAIALLGVGERGLGLLARRDVEDRADHAGELAVGTIERRLVEHHVVVRAVGVAHARLVDLDVARREQLVVGGLVDVGELLRRELVDILADDLVAGLAEVRLERLVATAIDPGRVLVEHRRRDRLEQRSDRNAHLLHDTTGPSPEGQVSKKRL